MIPRMLYLHALSPIHSGTGQSTDVIDLPVAREKVTGWPFLPASSLKGVLREACRPGDGAPEADQKLFTAAFGPDTLNASDGAGMLCFTDGHLLCLPVRSFYGSFAWLTCPLALRRWRRDHTAAGTTFPAGAIPDAPAGAVLLAQTGPLVASATVYLEDLDLAVAPGDAAAPIAKAIATAVFPGPPAGAAEDPNQAWRTVFEERFGIVHDDLFAHLTQTGTDVTARIKLDPVKKTVAGTALWYEEAVPAESIFAGPLLAAPRGGRTADELFGLVAAQRSNLLQIGGNASVGRGLIRLELAGDGGAA